MTRMPRGRSVPLLSRRRAAIGRGRAPGGLEGPEEARGEAAAGPRTTSSAVRSPQLTVDTPEGNTVVTAAIRGSETELGRSYDDGKLRLSDDCSEWDSCEVELAIGVPSGAVLKLRTGSGDLKVAGVAGAVTVKTGSGDVVASDLSCEHLQIETGSGDVRARLEQPPKKVLVDTGSGDVRLWVPEEAYSVDLHTGSGDEDVEGITTDSDASRTIRVDTGSGDVWIRGT